MFTIGITYWLIASRFAYWGLDQILIREVARSPAEASRYAINFLALRVVISGLIIGLLALGLSIWQPYSSETRQIIFLFGLSVLPESVLNLCQAVFIVFERMRYLTYLGGIGGALKLGGGSIVLLAGQTVCQVALVIFLSNLIVMFIALWLVFRHFVAWQWNLDLSFWWTQLSLALPFVLVVLVFVVDSQLDTLLLSWQLPEESVGIYGAAITIVVPLALVPQAYREAVFPNLARLYQTDTVAWQRVYRQSYKYLVLLALPIATGLTVLAEPLLIWVFGEPYGLAGSSLQVLAWSVALLFINVLHNRLIVVSNHQIRLAWYVLGTLSLNAVLNFLLVEQFGIVGAAVARLLANLLLFGLIYQFVYRRLYCYAPPWLFFVKIVVAVVVMGSSIYLFQSWPVLMTVFIGASIYGVMVVGLGLISWQELVDWGQVLGINRIQSRRI